MTATQTLPTFAEYVHGDETTRLTFERAYPNDDKTLPLYEHSRVYEAWDAETARRESQIARQLLRGDEWHRKSSHRDPIERMSCGTCALLGYEPRGGWGDDYKVSRDGPNYAGWRRVYVQAGRPMPAKWREAFAADTDNEAYNNALGRDIVTFGHPGFIA